MTWGTVPQMFGDTLGSPLVGRLSHGGGRRDRVDSDNLVHPVRSVGDRLVGVHGLELALHVAPQ